MSYFPASMPDQVLCKKHQLKALRKQHASWMKQREEALAKDGGNAENAGKQPMQPKQQKGHHEQQQPKVKTTFTVSKNDVMSPTTNDDKELNEMNDFLTAVGIQLDEEA